MRFYFNNHWKCNTKDFVFFSVSYKRWEATKQNNYPRDEVGVYLTIFNLGFTFII